MNSRTQAIGNYPTIQGSTFLNDEIWVHTSNGSYTYAYNQYSISGTPESIFKDFSISSYWPTARETYGLEPSIMGAVRT
ncbi:MAG: hypothetical protein R2809_08425 [Flavobacteriales bacterium]